MLELARCNSILMCLFLFRVKVDLTTPCPWNAKQKSKEARMTLKHEPKHREDPQTSAAKGDEHRDCDSKPLFGGSSMCSLSFEPPEQEDSEDDPMCESEQRLDSGHSMCSLATDSQLNEPGAPGFLSTPPSNARYGGTHLVCR